MKRKEIDDAGGEGTNAAEKEVDTQLQVEEGGTAKKLKADPATTRATTPSALHDSILHQLRRLGAQPTVGGGSTTAGAEEATTSSSSAAAAAASSSSTSAALAPAFLELNAFTFPSELFESEAWDLCDVELRNWWAPSTRGGRPAVEVGSAKRRSNGAYVYLALPTDTADPAHPVLFVKQKDGSDGQIGADDEGIPLADFLAGLQVPGAEDADEEGEEDNNGGGGDDDPYSGFISAIVAGEELPSEDEDDDDHDADHDDEEDADFEVDEDEEDGDD